MERPGKRSASSPATIAYSPEIIQQVYEQVGGEERFGTEPVVEQYERAPFRHAT
jgi:hypothetical protein